MKKICLILEGTYPYVTGGVSSFIHQLISNTPEISYIIIYLGASNNTFQEKKYIIPKNVEHIREIFLFDYNLNFKPHKNDAPINFERIRSFQQELKSGNFNKYISDFEYIYHHLFNSDTRVIDPMELFFSENCWDVLKDFYNYNYMYQTKPPFIDYFYTWRFSHYPLFKILMCDLPKADLYHSMSTGYAGLLASIGVMKYKKPFMLTEHGIYSHEREIEISQSTWITNYDHDLYVKEDSANFKKWWSNIFHFMSSVAYHHASAITTLYKGNQNKQVKYGALEAKTHLIPNGIKISNFSLPRKLAKNKINIGLVGRVVPIKDIKTFLKAIYFVKMAYPEICVYIIGPTDEDESYYQECLTVATIFDIKKNVSFTGKVNVKDYYPTLDLLVLSSISEGQPLVILEAFCSKIPVLATDVGACKEMILGQNIEDQELGPAGAIVPFGLPDLLGKKIIELISNRELLEKMGENGYKRVNQYYPEKKMIEGYTNFYNSLAD